MTDIEYIASRLSREDILCQLAEEAAELAKAAQNIGGVWVTDACDKLAVRKCACSARAELHIRLRVKRAARKECPDPAYSLLGSVTAVDYHRTVSLLRKHQRCKHSGGSHAHHKRRRLHRAFSTDYFKGIVGVFPYSFIGGTA